MITLLQILSSLERDPSTAAGACVRARVEKFHSLTIPVLPLLIQDLHNFYHSIFYSSVCFVPNTVVPLGGILLIFYTGFRTLH